MRKKKGLIVHAASGNGQADETQKLGESVECTRHLRRGTKERIQGHIERLTLYRSSMISRVLMNRSLEGKCVFLCSAIRMSAQMDNY